MSLQSFDEDAADASDLQSANQTHTSEQFVGTVQHGQSCTAGEDHGDESGNSSPSDWKSHRDAENRKDSDNEDSEQNHSPRNDTVCPRDGSHQSPDEYQEIGGSDRRAPIRIRATIQTDCVWQTEEACSQDDNDPDGVLDNPAVENVDLVPQQRETLQGVHHTRDGFEPQHHKSPPPNAEPEMETSPDDEALASLAEDPQTPTITEASGLVSSEDPSGSRVDLQCEYCHLPRQPQVTVQPVDNTDPEEAFCCEMALRSSEVGQKGARVVTPEEVIEGGSADRTDQGSRLEESKQPRRPRSSNRKSSQEGPREKMSDTICYRLSNEVWTAKEEISLPEMEIIDSPNALILGGEEVELKRNNTLTRQYNSGQTFITRLPDGTGQIYYPSGRLAVLMSAVGLVDFSYVVLEDTDILPSVQAVFTARGRATCYHQNGSVWVSLTPLGGSYCDDTGTLKRHWSWLERERHVHAPPAKTLRLQLNPSVHVHIKAQECIHLTFASAQRCVRLDVGARFRASHVRGVTPPASEDDAQRYLRLKRAEINDLLLNLKSLGSYQKPASLPKIQIRGRRRGRRTEKERGALKPTACQSSPP